MKQVIAVLLMAITSLCYGESLELDTIDNWQVYNGKHLLFAGHASPRDVGFQGGVKTSALKDLKILFNHCADYVDLEVVLQIADERDKIILEKKFKVSSGTSMIIDKKELGPLATSFITIRYREHREGGVSTILGRINLL